MKTKNWLPQLTILVGLLALIGGGYALARRLPDLGGVAAPGLPPLSKLDITPQTVDGITATIESYYADASHLIFTVRVEGEGEGYFLDNLSLTNARNEELNTGYGLTSPDNAPSVFLIDFSPAYPLEEKRLDGQLSFSVVAPNEETSLARFHFDLDLPVHPALTFNPKQSFSFTNGMKILLDRIVITPAYTYAYLCYIKPTRADWMIGGDATLRVDSQVASVQSYAILFDSDFSAGDKGGEPGWTPPVQNGRCVKIGFPIGAKNPESITLTIPNLEQSMPEVIPADELATAIKYLKDWEDIEMEWHIVDHGAYPEYKKLPAGMTEQEAYRHFIRALGYIYPGTWTFDLQLKPDENTRPKFTTSTYGAATPIPFPASEPRVAANLPGWIRSFDVSPDQKTIAFATSQGIVLYDLETYKHIRTLNETENFFNVEWSPDGRNLAAGGLLMEDAEVGQSHLVVWDSSTWKIVFEPDLSEELLDAYYGDMTWSPDGRFIATTNSFMGVLVYDIQSGEVISEQTELAAQSISWSPDGSRLVATGDLANGIRRWKVDTDEWVRLFDPRYGGSIRIAWSPDGQRIASANWEGLVCFWTVETNQCDGLIHAHRHEISGLAWSPDGSQIATGGGIIRIWDTQTGNLVTAFGEEVGFIYSHLAWLSPQRIVSLQRGMDYEGKTIVRFWDVDTGSILAVFEGGCCLFDE